MSRHMGGRGIAAALCGALLVTGWGPAPIAGASTRAGVLLANTVPGFNCPAETYPAAGAPANAPPDPYQVPVVGRITGGYLQLSGPVVTLTLGPPNAQYPNGQIFGELCGTLALPSQTGSIPANGGRAPGDQTFNNNFVAHGPVPQGTPESQAEAKPIPVAITVSGVNLPLLNGYADINGTVSAALSPQPAANGGLNVNLYVSTKSTAIIDPSALASLLPTTGGAPPSLPGGSLPGQVNPPSGDECTLAAGNVVQDGLPPTDPEAAQYTAPVNFTTGASQAPGYPAVYGQPVTGPITDGVAQTVANDFAVPPIDPNMPPAAQAPGAGTTPPDQLCTQSNANQLNQLLSLPAAPGRAKFVANSAFAINLCGEPRLPACVANPFG